MATPDIRVTLVVEAETEREAETMLKKIIKGYAKMIDSLDNTKAKADGFFTVNEIPEEVKDEDN